MRRTGNQIVGAVGLSMWLANPFYAQLACAQVGSGQQDATSILRGMPPDVLAKVQALAQILDQGIRDGKVTNEEIQRGLLSGQLREKLQQLNPEADRLISDLNEASREGKGLGQDSLTPLLRGLGNAPN